MKRAFFTLFILVVIGGFAFALGDKEEIGAAADSAVAAADVAFEKAVDNPVLLMGGPAMAVTNTTRYDFINPLDDKKRLIV